MKYLVVAFCFVFISPLLLAQSANEKTLDSLYKEDQFYVGVTYNVINKKPKDVSQTGFSAGVHFGFIKDIPFNKNRNFGMGIGLGGSINSFNQNLLIEKNEQGTYNYRVLDDNLMPFDLNRFYMHLVEMPIEFRWRTSTAASYKFWRIYSGIKLGYLLGSIASYESETADLRHTQIDDFNPYQYGLSFSAGYNTWNFYFYYALNPIFDNNANIDGVQIDTNAIKIGLLFYIL